MSTVRPSMPLFPNEADIDADPNLHHGPTEGGGDEVPDQGEAGEEMRAPHVLKSPAEPSVQEREEHRLGGHAVFRAWCRHCVRGRGRTWGHFAAPGNAFV